MPIGALSLENSIFVAMITGDAPCTDMSFVNLYRDTLEHTDEDENYLETVYWRT